MIERDPINAVWEMKRRFASNAVDIVSALFFILFRFRCRTNFLDTGGPRDVVPIYRPNDSPDLAWRRLVNVIAAESLKMKVENTFGSQLLRLFPFQCNRYWFPTWDEIMQYPTSTFTTQQITQADQPDPQAPNTEKLCIEGKSYECWLLECSIECDETTGGYRYSAQFADATGEWVVLGAQLRSVIDLHSMGPTVGKSYVLVDVTPETNVRREEASWWQENALSRYDADMRRKRVSANNSSTNVERGIWTRGNDISETTWTAHLILVCEKLSNNRGLRKVAVLEWHPHEWGSSSNFETTTEWLPLLPATEYSGWVVR
ncbi:hypothetical protein BDZ91DRAFT_555308 [Kalaharituber pfeilii]|nr:hypothetical protein BDZ91DRAFT_555308 [Kalaharituber pfeilii]